MSRRKTQPTIPQAGGKYIGLCGMCAVSGSRMRAYFASAQRIPFCCKRRTKRGEVVRHRGGVRGKGGMATGIPEMELLSRSGTRPRGPQKYLPRPLAAAPARALVLSQRARGRPVAPAGAMLAFVTTPPIRAKAKRAPRCRVSGHFPSAESWRSVAKRYIPILELDGFFRGEDLRIGLFFAWR